MQKIYKINGFGAEKINESLTNAINHLSYAIIDTESAYASYPSGKADITKRLVTISKEIETIKRRIGYDITYRT